MEFNSSKTSQTFWVLISSLSSSGLAILSAMILSRYLEKTDYGTYRQIIYVYNTLLVVFSVGLPKAFSYFLPRYSRDMGKAIVIKISSMLFVAGLAFSVVLYFSSDLIASFLGNNELGYGLKLFSPIPMLLLPTLGIEGIFSSYGKSQYIAVYNVISRLVLLVCIVGPVIFFEKDYVYALYGWVVASLFVFILALYFKGIPFKSETQKATGIKMKEILLFSIPLVWASLWGMMISAADTFYISRYFGVEVFAIYSNGFIQLPFLTNLTISVSIVLLPVFSTVLHKGSSVQEIIKVWTNAIKNMAIISYPLIIFFFVFSNEIMLLLFSYQYVESSIYFRINLIFGLFNIIVFSPLFLAMGKTKLYARIHLIIAILIWALGYLILILFNSPLAIAINSTVIGIVKILVFVYVSSTLLKVKFTDFFPLKIFFSSITHSVLVISVVVFLMNHLDLDNTLLKLSFSFFIYCLLLVLSSSIFKINYIEIIKPLMNAFVQRNKHN